MQEMQEMWVQSLGQEDPRKEETATHSSIFAWKLPLDRGAWQATVRGATKHRNQLNIHTHFKKLINFVKCQL